MKRLSLLLAVLLLSLSGHAETNSVLGAAETLPSVESQRQNALIPNAVSTWHKLTIDWVAKGYHSSIAVDSHDQVHIAFSDGENLWYTHQIQVGQNLV
ncbi:MAG: hypothetical protein ACUVSF_07285 [Anaerolineae bacterium]